MTLRERLRGALATAQEDKTISYNDPILPCDPDPRVILSMESWEELVSSTEDLLRKLDLLIGQGLTPDDLEWALFENRRCALLTNHERAARIQASLEFVRDIRC